MVEENQKLINKKSQNFYKMYKRKPKKFDL